MTYAVYTDFEAWSGRTVATADRSRMDLLLATASEIVSDEAGWRIAPSATETLRVDGPGGTVLNLPSKYVTAISEIAWADRRLDAPVVIDPTAYIWNQAGTVEVTANNTPWWLAWSVDDVVVPFDGLPRDVASLTVTLTHGYATVPLVVKNVVCDMVSLAINVPAEMPRGVTQMTTGGINMSFDFRQAVGRLVFSDEHTKLLAKYIIQ